MIKNNWENKRMPKAVITNKSGISLHGIKPGEDKVIEVDDYNVPKEHQWRRRLKDAKLDGCVELRPIKTTKKKESSE